MQGNVSQTNVDFVLPTSQETFKYMTGSLTKKEKISLLTRVITGEISTKDFPIKCQHITRKKKLQTMLVESIDEPDWETALRHYPVLAQNENVILQWIVSYDKEFKGKIVPKSWTNFTALIKETRVRKKRKSADALRLLDSKVRMFEIPPLTYMLCNVKISSMLDTLRQNKHFGTFCFSFLFLVLSFFMV